MKVSASTGVTTSVTWSQSAASPGEADLRPAPYLASPSGSSSLTGFTLCGFASSAHARVQDSRVWPLLSAFLHWAPSVLLRCPHFTVSCMYPPPSVDPLVASWPCVVPAFGSCECAAVDVGVPGPSRVPFWIPSGLYLAPELHSHLAVLCLTKSHFLNLGQQPWQESPSLVQLGPECHAYGMVPETGE